MLRFVENVFERPSGKCHFNGNVYEPRKPLSESDSKLSPCLASCHCQQNTYNKYDNSSLICLYYLVISSVIIGK